MATCSSRDPSGASIQGRGVRGDVGMEACGDITYPDSDPESEENDAPGIIETGDEMPASASLALRWL